MLITLESPHHATIHDRGLTLALLAVAFAERPDDPGNGWMWSFGAGDVVEVYAGPGGGVLVHFTRQAPTQRPAIRA